MKFELNRRTGQVQIVKSEPKTVADIMVGVKRQFRYAIQRDNIQDSEILDIINKVAAGTRNVRYLVDTNNVTRLRDIAAFIVNNS